MAFDNRDVVPYNVYLTRRFDCHINVEVVTSLKSVKYLFKYVHKGHDRASLDMRRGPDEIEAHLDARYVGPAEACWRLFGFPLHGMSHHVERLAVHLPDWKSVVFEEGREREALDRAADKTSTLEAWFVFNRDPQTPDTFKRVHYIDMPVYCTWDKKNSRWKQRSQGRHKVVGRLCGAAPTEQDRYFLYLLLLHTPGATSWEDLRRITGRMEPASTFQEAARQRGLLDDEDELRLSMADAQAWQMPSQFRQFFANLLLNAGVGTHAKALWEEFSESLAEDFARKKPEEVARDLALQDIQATLQKQGRKNSDFDGLPDPAEFDRDLWLNADLDEELNFDPVHERHEAEKLRAAMYTGQAMAFDAVANALKSGKGGIFFVDGPGGTGKSFLFQAIIHHARGKGKLPIACAWSGIAATMLPNGRTVSSRFALPVPLPEEHAQSNLTAQQAKGRLLKAAHIILWDEISMTPLEALDAADRCLQDIMENDDPFGGKILIMAGDFRQVLPVVPHGDDAKIKAHTVTRHSYFTEGKVIRFSLATNKRASGDHAYSDFLLELGDGRRQVASEVSANAIRLPDQIVASDETTYGDLARWVFGDVVQLGLAAARQDSWRSADIIETVSLRAVLAPKKSVVQAFNDDILKRFPPASVVEYLSTDRIAGENAEDYANFPVEFLNSLDLPGLPPHNMRLCPGVIIILLRNLNSNQGLCNGTRALLLACKPRCLDVLILTGKCKGERVFLPRITMSSQQGALPFPLCRRQFPCKLAWAMTINKAQGQSLQRAGLLLEEPVFAHGQLYVAASRAGSFKNFRVVVANSETQGFRAATESVEAGVYTDNIVYRDLLLGNMDTITADEI